jgi:C4-dicarboxylate-specific signal transduction histidine kinase
VQVLVGFSALATARVSAKILGMSTHPKVVTAPLSTPLARALDQNEAVQETVEQSADELLLINTVLKQEIPDHIQTDAVAQALQQGDELEGKIQESAENLAQVNQALEQEIAERVELERELADTKAALAEAQSQLPE